MAKTIVLLQYNNYFNRVVKGQEFTTLGAYESDGAIIVGQITNMVLWNPNDGVNTEITSSIELYSIPDYLLVIEDGSIVQRWFVMEARRLQKTQYRLRLRRDLLAENYNIVMFNPDSYIERGWCDVSDPAIYNQEPMTFNQIKSEQTILYDKSCVPWIVAYYVSNPADEEKKVEFKVPGSNKTCYFTIPAGGFRNSDDAPYTILFLPYDSIHVIDKTGTSPLETLQAFKTSRAAAMALSKEFSGSGKILDIQILPYCPSSAILSDYQEVTFSNSLTPNLKIYESTGDLVGYVFTTTSTSVAGEAYHIVGGTGTPRTGEIYRATVSDIKAENQTTFARLVSPNGNGVWEFTPAKLANSNGYSTKFLYQMTPMPYQPYIKVEPENFGRLYGVNYSDTRGLICGGDFSMPQISDSWTTYQIQNKNYEKMFNRQIDSMELQNKWAKRGDIANVITGTISGAVGGAAFGGAAGGIAGGIASAAAGAVDIYANEQIRSDQKDATIQQFNWQNENIQALPYGVSKSTNFNSEQPKAPYIEIYTCTDEEKNNFKKYLALRDYTINRYGRLVDYINPNGKRTFLRGTLLRLEGVQDDTHYIAAIADEVKQGFYIGTDSETNAGG